MDGEALMRLFKEGSGVDTAFAVRSVYEAGFHDGVESTKTPKGQPPPAQPVTSTNTATHTATAHPGTTFPKK